MRGASGVATTTDRMRRWLLRLSLLLPLLSWRLLVHWWAHRLLLLAVPTMGLAHAPLCRNTAGSASIPRKVQSKRRRRPCEGSGGRSGCDFLLMHLS